MKYKPFEEALLELQYYKQRKSSLLKKISTKEEKNIKVVQLSEEAKRKLLPLDHAFGAFMQSHRERKLASESISSYQGTIDWLYEGLSALEYIHLSINEMKHIHISGALSYIAEDRDWQATTINKEIDFAMTVLNWLETEEYIEHNPSKGKFIKTYNYVFRNWVSWI